MHAWYLRWSIILLHTVNPIFWAEHSFIIQCKQNNTMVRSYLTIHLSSIFWAECYFTIHGKSNISDLVLFDDTLKSDILCCKPNIMGSRKSCQIQIIKHLIKCCCCCLIIIMIIIIIIRRRRRRRRRRRSQIF